jgi:hypothetical protein
VKRALSDRLDRLQLTAQHPQLAGCAASGIPTIERTLAVLAVMDECGTIPTEVADLFWSEFRVDVTDNGRLTRV